MKKHISSGTEWENIVGYSRAVRVGNVIEVSGTVASDGNIVVGKNDVYLQTKFILKKIESALVKAEAALNDVVRTRIYVKDISKWNEIARAHQEVFANIKPAATMVEVSSLISPEYLVEIEATAVIEEKEIRRKTRTTKLEFKTHPKTKIGHIHLTVSNLESSLKFYRDVLGFEITSSYGEQAAFLSAGGYHHHIGLNTWAGEGASRPHLKGTPVYITLLFFIPAEKN